MLQGGLLFFILLYFYYIAGKQEVSSYIYGLYITYSIAFIGSLILLFPYLTKRENKPTNKPFIAILKEMFTYGLWGSADNIAEVLTTRLNYFLIQRPDWVVSDYSMPGQKYRKASGTSVGVSASSNIAA